MICLRPYQDKALDAVLSAALEERYLLLQAATGAGKTILFSALIKQLMGDYSMRIAIVAHREILVRQAHEKLLKVWPEGKDLIGIACASVSSKTDIDSPVIIGSPQTLASRVSMMETPIDLLIVDEAHRLPPRNAKSQYRTLIQTLEGNNPDFRMLGVTATPFRLGHGYVYGDKCRPSAVNWFSKLHYQVSIDTLTKEGFLVSWRGKEADNIATELSGISLSGGDYNLGQLEDMMSDGVHIENAVNAVKEHAEDRKHIVVFCTTIAHAELMAEAFEAAGYPSACVHSNMSQDIRHQNLADFEAGNLRVIANVGVLTEGWDCTAVDCLVMCRPTKSPALYVQIIGRGLRTHDGKEDCLILDLSNNFSTHGNPNAPTVLIPGDRKKLDQEPYFKTCPECEEVVSANKRECPGCGYLWKPKEVQENKRPVSLKDVSFLAGPQEKTAQVERWDMKKYTSKAGNEMVKLTVYCKNGGIVPIIVNHFLDFAGNASEFGKRKAIEWLRRHLQDDYSIQSLDRMVSLDSIDDVVSVIPDLIVIPYEVTVINDGKYNKVKGW